MLKEHKLKLNNYTNEIIFYDDIPNSDIDKIKRIDNADCVLLSYTSSLSKEVLKNCPNLKYIGLCCSLYSKESSNVDIDYAENNNIIVKGIRDYGDEGVVEYVIHELVEFLQGYKELKWDNYPHEISSLKCGVIGLGTSGSMIAEALKYFKADVSYYSRTRKYDKEEKGIKYKDLHILLKESDAIFLALNKNVILLNEEEFNLMKGKKILFNTSIGPGFDISSLKKWLKEDNHYFFGDTLDTIGDKELFKLNNTKTINRSAGGKSYEAYYRLGEKVINNIEEYLKK